MRPIKLLPGDLKSSVGHCCFELVDFKVWRSALDVHSVGAALSISKVENRDLSLLTLIVEINFLGLTTLVLGLWARTKSISLVFKLRSSTGESSSEVGLLASISLVILILTADVFLSIHRSRVTWTSLEAEVVAAGNASSAVEIVVERNISGDVLSTHKAQESQLNSVHIIFY